MTVIMYGKFTEEELKELAAWLRRIQNKHPESDYFMMIEGLTDKLTAQQAIETMKRIFPRNPVAG